MAVVERLQLVEMAVLHGEVVNLVNLELWVTEGTVDFTQLLLVEVEVAVAVLSLMVDRHMARVSDEEEAKEDMVLWVEG